MMPAQLSFTMKKRAWLAWLPSQGMIEGDHGFVGFQEPVPGIIAETACLGSGAPPVI
jgi:hypothetical protein